MEIPRLTPPSTASVIFSVRLAVFTAAAVVVAVTIDEIACIAAENASSGAERTFSGHNWHMPHVPGGESESQDVHRQALHWDGGGESPSSLVAVGTIFCMFCIGGVLSAVAFFIAARPVLPHVRKTKSISFFSLCIMHLFFFKLPFNI